MVGKGVLNDGCELGSWLLGCFFVIGVALCLIDGWVVAIGYWLSMKM